MGLIAPNLDDRHFQDLVDDAKRLVQRRCPEWSDHNVSDPGVTLIEAFAGMVDQLIYRLNQVPDATYLRFLDMIGVSLFPPTAARADITFWLSAPQPDTITVPAGTHVGTLRSESEEAIVFEVVNALPIPPCELAHMVTAPANGPQVSRDQDLAIGTKTPAFASPPQPGDVVLFGLSQPIPRGALLLRLDCDVEGVGVDPRDPPLVWEAWTGASWTACVLDSDSTGGLNRAGDVILHIPDGHTASVLAQERAGWIRCRVVDPAAGQPFYSAPPTIKAASAANMGGTTTAVHAETVTDEIIGLSEGVPGQRFDLQHKPVVPMEGPMLLEVSAGHGWDEWTQVESFAQTGPDDRHFRLDATEGRITFGQAVREPDGTLRHYGAVPPKGAAIRLNAYRHGGGRRGNVARGLLRVLRDPVPFVAKVENREPAVGGVEGEQVREAASRGPLTLRTRDRAVTVEDYEYLARQAAPQLARVRAVPVSDEAAAVRVLVVPAAAVAPDGSIEFADLAPPADTLIRVAEYLEERRCAGARVLVEPPYYQGVTVVAALRCRSQADPIAVRERALTALLQYLNPLVGGPDHDGWPFGRPVQMGEVFATLQQVKGVDLVEDVKLFAADPITGERGEPTSRIELATHGLVQSYQHQVRVNP